MAGPAVSDSTPGIRSEKRRIKRTPSIPTAMACKGHPASICWLLSGPCHSSHQSTQAPRFERRCLQRRCTLKEINGAERCLYEALHACGLIFTRSPTRLQDFSAHLRSTSKGAAPDLDYFAFACLHELRLCFLLKPAIESRQPCHFDSTDLKSPPHPTARRKTTTLCAQGPAVSLFCPVSIKILQSWITASG